MSYTRKKQSVKKGFGKVEHEAGDVRRCRLNFRSIKQGARGRRNETAAAKEGRSEFNGGVSCKPEGGNGGRLRRTLFSGEKFREEKQREGRKK